MQILEVKSVKYKNRELEIELNKNNNMQREYALVAIERKYKDIIILKENINIEEDNIITLKNYNITKKLRENSISVLDLALKSKDTNKIYILKMDNNFDIKNTFRFINPLIDLKYKVNGYIYYALNREIAIQLTKTPEEALKKCKNDIYTIKNTDGEILTIQNKNIDIKGIKLRDNRLELIFDNEVQIEKSTNIKPYLVSRESKEKYLFEINKKHISKNKLILDLNKFIEQHSMVKDRWDLFLQYIKDGDFISGNIRLYKKQFETKASRHLKCTMNEGTNVIVPYITIKNEIAIMVNTYQKYINEKYKHRIEIDDINVKNKKMIIEGNISFNENIQFEVEKGLLELRNKTKENIQYDLGVESKVLEDKKVKYTITVDVDKYKYEQFYWDLYLILNIDREKIKIRLKNPNEKVISKINNKVIKYTFDIGDNYMLYPYVTMNNCVSMTYRQQGKYETKKYKIKEKIAEKIYKLFKHYFDSKEIWLIYEKFSETAQDNSFYFFKHCYENHKYRNIYYIITKDSKDYANVEKYKNKVVHFMSIKHLVYMCAAKLLIASESKGHSYAWRVQRGYIKEKLNEKKMVFLQHGVTALKRVDGVFKKTSANGVDLFVATSTYEKDIIKKYFNYKSNEIIVTGFTRWDVLKDKSNQLKYKEIFFMPTWRNWLDEVPESEFEKSPYFKNYMEILNSEELSKILEENNLTIKYFVHPKFKYYLDKFSTSSERIKVVQPGEVQVNELLMRASLLITDYSSVAWEMYYQNKPTLFYHFDIDDYNKYQGSYLDMEHELFGDKAMNPNELIDQIKKYIETDFEHPKQYVEMRKKYFSFVDDKNCERTFDAILSKKKSLYKVNLKRQELLKSAKQNIMIKRVWSTLKNDTILGLKIVKIKETIFAKLNIEHMKNKKANA